VIILKIFINEKYFVQSYNCYNLKNNWLKFYKNLSKYPNVLFGIIFEYIFSNYSHFILISSVPFQEHFISLYSLCIYKTAFLENFALLGCYVAYVGCCLPTFRYSLPVPSSRVRSPRKTA
jgi:hypothetical protein